jgi:biopolymer transport protein ExbB
MNKRWFLVAMSVCAASAFAAAAQSSNEFQQVAASISGGVTHDFSLRDIFARGGILMYPLALLSILTLAMIIYFGIIMQRQQMIPARFVTALQGLIREGKLSEARALCHTSTCAVAAVLESAIDYSIRCGGRPDSGLLREIIEGEGARQATLMQNQTQYLQDIGVIAPMIGLLGTVWGMLKAFNAVAIESVGARPIQLAGGVSLSLITTAGGLAVAIPAMAGYFFFRNRAAKLTAELEVTAAKLLLELGRVNKS